MATFSEIRERSDVPVVVANHEGFITYINSEFTKIFGWKPEALLGQPLTKILPQSFSDAHNLAFSRFQMTEIAGVLNHPLELITVTEKAEEIMTEHYIAAEKIDGEWLFAAMLRPL